MCPPQLTTNPVTHTLPTATPNMTSHTHRNPSHNKKQNTLWNFIYAKLPEGPTNNGVQEPLTPLDTQGDLQQLTPLACLPKNQEEPIMSPSLHQPPLAQNTNNDSWGDADAYSQTPDCFCILSKNVSTLHPQSLDMMAMAIELQHSNASVFLAQETNTAWQPPALCSIHAQCSKVH